MLKKPLIRKSSAPMMSVSDEYGEMLHSCAIRFLDDSEPMSVHFKVRCLLYFQANCLPKQPTHNKWAWHFGCFMLLMSVID